MPVSHAALGKVIMKQASGIAPVDFLIAGASRTGTTSLFEILRRHPDVFIPARKECRYFSALKGDFVGPSPEYANRIIHTPEDYRALFKKAKPGQLRGDISPDYLYYYQNAVPKILAEAGAQTPVIIILRNPIDRAYSQYLFHVSQGRERLTFEEALVAEAHRLAENWPFGWFYVGRGMYAEQVQAYRDAFERVLLLVFEQDITSGKAIDKILPFLGLSAQSIDVAVHVNAGGYPKHRLLHRWLTPRNKAVSLVKDFIRETPLYNMTRRFYRRMIEATLERKAMKPETRAMLTERFRENVNLLVEQTGLPVHEYWRDFQSPT